MRTHVQRRRKASNRQSGPNLERNIAMSCMNVRVRGPAGRVHKEDGNLEHQTANQKRRKGKNSLKCLDSAKRQRYRTIRSELREGWRTRAVAIDV